MKKIISLLIALTLCLSVMPCAFAEETLQQKIDYISSLGIMTGYEDGSFRSDNQITRAEFTAVAIRLAGQGDSSFSGMYDGRFSDVSSDHWAAGYIALALNMGIISGYGDGTFRPENPVTYNEAIKMVVCLLGYGIQAEKLGGYPSGYIGVATQQNLMDFEHYGAQSAINRGEVARLVYNALEVELLITESIGKDGNYVIGKGGTVLEMLFSAETKKGVVTATEVDSLTGNKISKGHVEIDHVIYTTDIDCTGFLGEKVEYVVTNRDSVEKVVYIKSLPSSKVITIKKEDVVDITGIFTSNGTIRYWNANKSVRSISFTSALNVIYNNKVLLYEQSGLVDFYDDGDVFECIDTDNDGKYDLLKVKAYDDNYVKKTYVDGEKLSAVTDDGILITYDPEDEDLNISVVYQNEEKAFDEIKEDDVISVAKSIDGKSYEIIIAREVLEGKVEGRSEDETETILVVNSKEYKVSDTLIAKLAVPALNDEGAFYLSYEGKIAYFEGTDTAKGTYGFLTAVENKTKIGTECNIKILETNNTFSVYPLAEKVKFSNKGSLSTKTAAEIVAAFYREPTWDDVRVAHTQIIRYKLNSDGEVNYIATAKEYPDENEFSIAAPNRKYFYSNSLFDQKWKATPSTVVFYIPATKDGELYTRYRAGTAAKYFANGNAYQTQLYDVDENGEIGAIFYSLPGRNRELTFSVDYAGSKIMTIHKVVYQNDEDGIEHCVVSGIVNNTYTSIYVDEEFLSSSANRDMLKFGNIIQYQTNSSMVQAAHYEGEKEAIVKAILWCDFSTTLARKLYNRSAIEQRTPKITTVYGTVISVDNTKVTISTPDGDVTQTDVFIDDTQPVVKINKEEKSIDMGTFYDIQPGKKIFVRMRYDRIKDVMIAD